MYNMTPVNSDRIKAIGYDDKLNVLAVEFSDENIHRFLNVDIDTFTEFLFCEDKDEYISTNIEGKYLVTWH